MRPVAAWRLQDGWRSRSYLTLAGTNTSSRRFGRLRTIPVQSARARGRASLTAPGAATIDSMENWKPPEEQAEEAARVQAEHEGHVEALNRHWRGAHRKRTRAIERQLMSALPNATAVDKVLVKLAAHDAAVAELVGDAQVLLASRVVALVDNPKSVATLTRALSESTSCRNAAARRVEALMQTVTTMRTQRAFVESEPKAPHLRCVA